MGVLYKNIEYFFFVVKYEGMKDTHGNKVIRNVFLCFLFVGFIFWCFKMLFGIMIGNFYSIIVLYIEKV
ncbi:hypothetical protein PFFVO_05419 [Plasmodium falciparum Vietnam Oak-Knoll (FVO)]|uniref:Uncharacterized protein n=1 Tax=Plasmodium falciparum Vietnam Oak-Knoll (FVO) TaxID=1036723 RepID=A0A024UZI4_PLAFA|nr:hypothetical protein PFFVO_05419 [Plasmodium falciparum Vietnam Oak-Knoll (FVO)]